MTPICHFSLKKHAPNPVFSKQCWSLQSVCIPGLLLQAPLQGLGVSCWFPDITLSPRQGFLPQHELAGYVSFPGKGWTPVKCSWAGWSWANLYLGVVPCSALHGCDPTPAWELRARADLIWKWTPVSPASSLQERSPVLSLGLCNLMILSVMFCLFWGL